MREKYPLDKQEERLLAANLAFTQAVLLIGGVAGAIVVRGLLTGDWREAALGLGWARGIATALGALPLATAFAGGLALAAAFGLAAWTAERQALRTDHGESVIGARRGVNGELPRMNLALAALLLVMAGCAEELLFRFVLLGGVGSLLSTFMPAAYAALCALVLSSVVFWMAHVQYRDLYSTLVVLVLAVALGLAYLFTGSLTLVIVAHAGYDLADILIERHRMETEPDYFRGPAPARVLLDMMEQAEEDDGGDAS